MAWLLLSLVVVLLDQWSKLLVVDALELGERIQVFPFFAWVYWRNDGAAFSLLSGAGGWQIWLFVALGVLFFGFIINELRQLTAGQRWHGFAFGLLLGGAVGNLIDRVALGYVVDFILFHYHDAIFPAFNVADAAITVGAATWIVLLFREGRQRRDEGAEAGPGA